MRNFLADFCAFLGQKFCLSLTNFRETPCFTVTYLNQGLRVFKITFYRRSSKSELASGWDFFGIPEIPGIGIGV